MVSKIDQRICNRSVVLFAERNNARNTPDVGAGHEYSKARLYLLPMSETSTCQTVNVMLA